jgi:hypothetical protein
LAGRKDDRGFVVRDGGCGVVRLERRGGRRRNVEKGLGGYFEIEVLDSS